MTFSALDSALTGPLFSTPEMAAVFSDRAKLQAMLACEAALARVQAKHGLVPEALAAAIEAVRPEMFDLAALGEATALAGVPVIPFLKALQAHLPGDFKASLHKGATTQDIVDTAMVLQMRQGLALVRKDLGEIIAALLQLAGRHRATPCVGRTYGQHAAPVTFGFKVAVWCAGIAEVAAQLHDLQGRVLTGSLFGPVGTLAAMGRRGWEVYQGFCHELGLNHSEIAWHTRRARPVEVGTWLATLLGALSKMAGDIVFLTSTEVAEVFEPHVPGRGGSSAMPHKRNPVASTLILAAASASTGHVMTLLDSMQAAHERPAGAWHAEWHALPQLFGLAAGALRETKLLARGLVVDEARMRRNIDITRGLLFADAAAGVLAGPMGREAAHHCVETASGKVRDTGAWLAEVLAADPELAAMDLAGALAKAFELTPALDAAALWADRGCAEATRILENLPSHES